ncbi:MAG: hypothetical protein QM690_07770 [Sphingobium sp.]
MVHVHACVLTDISACWYDSNGFRQRGMRVLLADEDPDDGRTRDPAPLPPDVSALYALHVGLGEWNAALGQAKGR